jgi:hypothetical protein
MGRLRRIVRISLLATAVLAVPVTPAAAWFPTPPPDLAPDGGSGTPAAGPTSGPTVPGEWGALVAGVAYAPEAAPRPVKQAIWAANQIRRRPYRWGGGHRSFRDRGYDCSGAVSYALHGGGLLASPLDSRGFMRWGQRGAGRWISVYANKGHVFAVIAGLRFDTSGPGERGPRWRPFPRSTAGFKVRHPSGL